MKHVLSAAILYATQKHHGTFDKGGMPYIFHCLKVMHYTKSEDEELLAIAVLHDVIEDTDATYTELREIGMTERVIEGVKCLTKVPGESPEEYLEKVKSTADSVIVKKADLRHNTDIRRLKGVTEKDIKRVAKYQRMFVELELHQREMKG